jgi:uncharacterized membrane protein
MNTSPFVVLTAIAALLTAVAAGMMYVFSSMVMRGLDRTGPVDAITAMRGINAQANTSPAFLLVYFGAAVVALVVGVMAVVKLDQPGTGWVLAGAISAVLAAAITMIFNVPLNNHLDTVDPAGVSVADAAREWAAYMSSWTGWNHVRSATGIVGAGLLSIGLLYQ